MDDIQDREDMDQLARNQAALAAQARERNKSQEASLRRMPTPSTTRRGAMPQDTRRDFPTAVRADGAFSRRRLQRAESSREYLSRRRRLRRL